MNAKMSRGVKYIVGLLFSGWCIIWVFRTLIGAVHPEIMEVVGNQSAAGMGLISSCYFAGYVAMQIPGGFLMDRFGKWRILIPSFALMAAGFLLVAIAGNIGTIYAGCLLAGVGSGTYYSGAFSLSSQSVPRDCKYFATAFVNTGCALGMLLGYVYASGGVRQLGFDWRAVLYVLTALTLLLILMIRVPAKQEREELKARKDRRARRGTDWKLLRRTLFTPKMIASYFFYFSTCYGYYMIVSWLPTFLQNERGMSGVLAGYASSVIALVSIPGALFLGKIVDRFSRHRVAFLTVIQIISGVMLVCLTSFAGLGLIIASLALYGLSGKQAVDPLIVPHVTEQFGDVALSTGLGVFNFFGMSASVIAPYITGRVCDMTGSQKPGFYIAVAVLIISSLAFRLVSAREKGE